MKPIFIQTKNLQNQPERTLNENLNYICCKINNLIDSYNKKLRINTKYSRINRPTSNKTIIVKAAFKACSACFSSRNNHFNNISSYHKQEITLK